MKNAHEGTDFKFLDRPGGDFSGQMLAGADFSRAKLSRCTLRENNLKEAVFVGADMESAKIENSDMEHADLTRAALRQAKVEKSNLNRIRAAGMRANEAEFRSCGFQKAEMCGASLDFSQFKECDLRGADFSGASLLGAKFTKCDLSDVSFVGADLSDADLVGAAVDGVDFSYADLNHADLSGVDFRRAKIVGARFWMCSGVSEEQRQVVRAGGGSLYSPFVRDVMSTANFFCRNRPAQVALFLLFSLISIHVARHFVDPGKMSSRRLIAAASRAADKGDSQKANALLTSAMTKIREKENATLSPAAQGLMLKIASIYWQTGGYSEAASINKQVLAECSSPSTIEEASLALGACYVSLGDKYAAIDLFQQMIDNPGTSLSSQAYAKLGLMTALETDQPERALEIGETLLSESADPDVKTSVHQEMARLSRSLGDIKSTAIHLEAVGKAGSDEGAFEARLELLMLTASQYPLEARLAKYEAFLASPENRPWANRVRLTMGWDSLRGHETTKARRFFEEVLSAAETDQITFEVLRGLASVDSAEGKQEEALVRLEKLLKQLGKSANPGRMQLDVLLDMAKLNEQLGRTQAAKNIYERVLQVPVDDATVRFDAEMGLAAFSDGPENTLAAYQACFERFGGRQGLEWNNRIARLLGEMSRTSSQLGREKEAKRYSEEMSKRTGDDKRLSLDAQLVRADIERSAGRPAVALEIYRRLLVENKRSPENLVYLIPAMSQLLVELDRPAETEAFYLGLIKDPGLDKALRFDAKLQLAGLKQRRAQWEEALVLYEELLADRQSAGKNVDLGRVILAAARLNAQLEKAKKAEALYKETLKVAEGNRTLEAEAKKGLADLERKAGRLKPALKAYEAIWKDYGSGKEWVEPLGLVLQDMAQLNAQMGNLTKAQELYDELGSRAGNNEWFQFQSRAGMADLKRLTGQKKEALEILKGLLKDYGTGRDWLQAGPISTVLHQMAWINKDLGNLKEAERLYGEVLRKTQDDNMVFAVKLDLATLKETSGQPAKALAIYEELLQQFGKKEALRGRISDVRRRMEEIKSPKTTSPVTKQ